MSLTESAVAAVQQHAAPSMPASESRAASKATCNLGESRSASKASDSIAYMSAGGQRDYNTDASAARSEDSWRHLWSYAFPHMQPVAPAVKDLGLPQWWLSGNEIQSDKTTMPNSPKRKPSKIAAPHASTPPQQ